MKITKDDYIKHLQKLAKKTQYFGIDADYDETFQCWMQVILLPAASQSLAVQLYIHQMDDKILRDYLIELNSNSGNVKFMDENGTENV